MATTNLTIVSAVVHPGPEGGAEQITITLNGSLGSVDPAGNPATKVRPSADKSSQYEPTGYVGETVVLTTDDEDSSYTSLASPE